MFNTQLTPLHGRWKCLKVGGASSGRGHGERVEHEPITGVWGRSPQRGPGAEPLVGAPLKLKAFWFLNVPRSGKTYSVVSFYLQRVLAIAILSVRLSVRPSLRSSHGWISQKRCKLELPNLHPQLPGRL